MAQTLPPERLAQLRQLIHSRVSEMGVREQIRGCLTESFPDGKRRNEATLMRALEERGVVNHVMQSLNLSSVGMEGEGVRGDAVESPKCLQREERPCEENATSPHGASLTGNKRYLFLQVRGGKAFLEHLQDNHDDCQATLTLHIHFRGQRFHSRPSPCSCEPDLREGFLLELVKGGKEARAISYVDALAISDLIHLVVVRKDSRGERKLIGTFCFEWRPVLATSSGVLSQSVELSGVGTEAKIPAGVLELRLEIFPKVDEEEEGEGEGVLSGDVVSAQLSLERQRVAERERLFLVYAKQWWREYLQIRENHSQRKVKIFAQDESGVNRLVCTYVRPLRAGRLLDSPRHAARFVSLIPFEKTVSVGGCGGGCPGEVWSSLHSLLSRRKGDCEDHAVLLCSLLLGFGMDAYVCIGTKVKHLAHCWVVTLGHDGAVTFWESLTGQRFLHPEYDPNTQAGSPPPSPPHPYRTLSCLFNHQSFYANTQPSNSVLTARFDLHNGSLWKAMSTEAIKSVTIGVVPASRSSIPPLLPSQSDPILAANELELQLRDFTAQHRSDLELGTVWDDNLSYLLSPALSAYELERSVGVTVGNEEFQEAIRRVVPEGHTFKGFPIQFTHQNARRAFTGCLKSPVCREILGCHGDHVRLAVRVKVYFFPEDVCAVWIMFACTYRSVL